ncbi:hypothetical protein MOB37_18595 [Bacillus spizizenii]|uniref:hypothetical protein n=1 Tax=Bacillus inaquosorum TaxID=483913 RepID=UPI0022824D0D|nr:hypothetical protein [Bacillus inaquosorum]MCY7829889.1 hypothetical protein [Bacillus spizizenii]MCY8706797.1 hypothetical protein [Bacillus inaquosorum]
MTMVIAQNLGDSLIMTADRRITNTNHLGEVIGISSDDYKKIKIVNNKYIISFAGRVHIAKKAFEFIDEKINTINKYMDPHLFFKKAFNYGKEYYEENFPGEPLSVFYLGYLKQKEPKLIGFSSDDNYNGIEVKGIIKRNSKSSVEEKIFINETIDFINDEISRRQLYYKFPRNLAEIFSKAIKRVDDVMIGETTYSVVLSQNGIEEYYH